MKILTQKDYKFLQEIYKKDKTNSLIENAISNIGIKEASKSKFVINSHDFIFSNSIDIGEATDQKSSGRCWMFAGLNMVRNKLAKKLNMENFELSENHLYFYDNMEKTNHFLERIIDTKNKDINDREVEEILYDSPNDGGYYEYFYYLINKYGIVPKTVSEETYHSSNSHFMFFTLEKALKNIAMKIRKKFRKFIGTLRGNTYSSKCNNFDDWIFFRKVGLKTYFFTLHFLTFCIKDQRLGI